MQKSKNVPTQNKIPFFQIARRKNGPFKKSEKAFGSQCLSVQRISTSVCESEKMRVGEWEKERKNVRTNVGVGVRDDALGI